MDKNKTKDTVSHDNLGEEFFRSREQQKLLKDVNRLDRHVWTFSKAGDRPLNELEVEEIHKFWKKYEFLYKVDLKSFEVYTNRIGIFDKRYLPNGFFLKVVRNKFQNPHYLTAFKDKNYTELLLKHVKQPKTIIRKVQGIYFDKNFQRISLEEAVGIGLDYLRKHTEFIVKPTIGGGGRGIEFFSAGDYSHLREYLENFSDSFMIQELIHQQPDISKMYASAVNTVRINSIIFDGKVEILVNFMRIGTGGGRMDNMGAGGIIAGIDKQGKLKKFAFGRDGEKYFTHPDTGLPIEGFKIVGFEKVIEIVKKIHIMIPQLGFLAWDFAIDHEDEPVLIEYNMAPVMSMPQFLNGPFLGEKTEEILDYVLKKHYVDHANEHFNFREFHNRVEIHEYVGRLNEVAVPTKLLNKPVTIIGRNAFKYNRNVKKVNLPDTVRRIGTFAFLGCRNLELINVPKNLRQINDEAFKGCSKLNIIGELKPLRKMGKNIFEDTEYFRTVVTSLKPN